MIEVVQIPLPLFNRMSKALIEVEGILAVKSSDTWVGENVALELLGCKKTKLFELKKKGAISYKSIGRKNQYSRKSIEKFINKHSS